MLQSGVGGGGPGGGAGILQASFSPSGAAAYVILTDSREPSLQLVLAPGPEGRTAKASVTARPARAPGLSLEGEVSASAAGALGHVKAGAKLASADAYSTASLTLPLASPGAPAHAEFSYHQTLPRGLTAGGSLSAALALAPPAGPAARGAQWAAWGSWTSPQRDTALLLRASPAPRADGPPLRALNFVAWRRATRALELSATLGASLALGRGAPAVADSSAGVGAKMTFEGAGGGLNPVLCAHLSGRTSGVSLQVPFAGPGSATFLRTTGSFVADHAARDYKAGMSVEMYY